MKIPTAKAAPRRAGSLVLLLEINSRPGTPVPPPRRAFRRQCRFAASRIADSSNRSRQPTGDSRPPAAAGLSPPKPPRGEPDRWRFQQKQAADRGLPSSVPRGKVQEGVSPSWFPAPAPERIRIIFPGDTRGGKNSSHGATCRGRLSGPDAKAERYRHRRNAGADSGKWLRHFPETLHGAKCGRKAAFGRACGRARAE